MEFVYWAIPHLLAGRPGPQEASWTLRGLRQAGFRAIVSLDAAGVDQADIRGCGLAHKLLPMPDDVPPAPHNLGLYRRQVAQAGEFIHEHVANGDPTLVHCHAGKDRTGVVLAWYLCTHRGTTARQAIDTLRRAKPTILSAEGYEALLHQLLEPSDQGS